MSKTFSTLLTKLKKTYADAIKDVDEAGVIYRHVLSSPQLNYLFGGGLPVGRIIQLHGPESGGKSTLATYIAGEIQKLTKKVVIYVDFERTFEKAFAEKLGLQTSEDLFLLLRPENGEEGFTILEELVKTGEVALIILDSDTTMPAVNQIAKEYGAATFGAGAKLLSDALRKFNPILDKYKTSMFVISQERDNVGSMGYGPDYKVTGGRAIKFYASNRSRVQRIDYIKDKGVVTGIQMRVKNEKNKAGIPFREAMLTLSFEHGFNTENEYMDFIISLGVCEQRGAWFYMPQYGLEKANGRDAVQDWLNHHPDEYEKIKLEVNNKLCGKIAIDENNEIVDDPEFDEPPEIEEPPEIKVEG